MNGFSVEIKESTIELTAKERIRLKDTTNAIKLDEATQIDKVVISPVGYAILAIHNEKATPNDYENYLVMSADGKKYVTGSKSFWDSFMNIYNEMKDESDAYEIEIYRVPSKNYKGKDFISCSIL